MVGGGGVGGGGGGGEKGCVCSIANYIAVFVETLIKSNLRFSFFFVFLVSKGNILDFYSSGYRTRKYGQELSCSYHRDTGHGRVFRLKQNYTTFSAVV